VDQHRQGQESVGGHHVDVQSHEHPGAAEQERAKQADHQQHVIAPVPVEHRGSDRRQEGRGKHPNQADEPHRLRAAVIERQDPDGDRHRPLAGPDGAEGEFGSPQVG
jgi:hypothetical protein